MSGGLWPVPCPVLWPVSVAGGRSSGVSARRYRNYDDDDDDHDDDDEDDEDDYDFSSYENRGLGACVLVIEHEQTFLWFGDAVKHERCYCLGMDGLVIGCSQT